MKIMKLLGLCILCAGMVSCDANKSKVTDVAKEFMQALANNDKVTMYELYPSTRVYTNLVPIKGMADANIKVEVENDSIYIANLDTKKKLLMKISADGQISIIDSYNVLLLDSVSYELAAKTGVPANQLSDMTKGQLFLDHSDYMDLLADAYPLAMNGNLYEHNVRYSWHGGIYPSVQFDTPVTNGGKSNVKGTDYSMEIAYFRKDTKERIGTSVEEGVDLASDETYVFTTWKSELYNYAFEYNLYCTISFHFKNMSQAAILAKYGTFSGEEYQIYKKWVDREYDNAGNSDKYNQALSDRKLTETDLNGLSKKDLDIMKNMIYAKYGYKFNREDLANYFSKFSWYSPQSNDAAAIYNQMTSIEKYNIEFIKKHEQNK